ncbi:MAG TPA: FMN-binding negative transcriptional regulator [Gemmatimonadaceae bacterium]|nr:FMN-binding negative transcriptional regulator [Gemmatimonadaceae bacterium]
MYVPAHFEETDVAVLHGLIRAHPLGAFVALTAAGLDANHLPVVLDPAPAPFGTLRAHVARSNPIWRQLSAGVEAVAIFQGVERYISPSWYPSKAATGGKVVPTWNYAVVHAYGALRVVDDHDWLARHLAELVDVNERDAARPWRMADAPADWLDRMVGAVVGLELPVSRLMGKWKLSQNRDAADRAGVVEALTGLGGEAAAAMAEAVRGATRE